MIEQRNKTGDHSISLIYILSNGRSGSTLLDLLLGMHPVIWTLGEAHILPWELRKDVLPCGCGKLVSECPFWKMVAPQLSFDEYEYSVDYFRERHTGGKIIRWNHLFDILHRKPTRKWDLAVREYGKVNSQYFTVAKEVAQRCSDTKITWLVDASKDIYRLFWMQQAGLFNQRVIHLVKDPRAFVYSMVKQNPRDLSKVVRFAGRWLVENVLFRYLLSDPGFAECFFLLRYEDLAREPDEMMKKIGVWLELDTSGFEYFGFRQYENHAIAGNLMRWEGKGIKLDQKWRGGLPAVYAQLIWCITGPLARSLGYQKEYSFVQGVSGDA